MWRTTEQARLRGSPSGCSPSDFALLKHRRPWRRNGCSSGARSEPTDPACFRWNGFLLFRSSVRWRSPTGPAHGARIPSQVQTGGDTMREAGPILGYAGLPALLAVVVLLPLVSSDGPTAPAAAPPPQAAGDAGDPSPPVEAPASFRRGRELIERITGGPCCGENGPDRVRTLIALLPDPDQSSLDWTYDSSLSAIRRALEAAGYTSDRSWFPDFDALVARAGDGDGPLVPQPEAEPAVLVFRGDHGGSTRDLALVYVVGEVPTTGVHKEALRAALTEAAVLEGGDTLRVLGPTFSGSVPSLRAVLEDPLRALPEGLDRFHLRVISGSATSHRNLDLLTRELRSPFDTVSYSATVHTDEAFRVALETRVLEPLGLMGSEVALLTESNTGYGAALRPGEGSGETTSAASMNEDAGPHSLSHAVAIPFPLNIAALRAEYDRHPADTVEGGFRLPGRASRIPLTLQLRSRPLEVPPARSGLTAPSVDIALAEILRTLRAHRIKAVGILASDVRDKLFLAELIRRYLPDALLFTYEGNILFLRPELARRLRGMVVVSTYPLILENAVWTGTPTQYLAFPGEGALGVFNAALVLLDKPDLVYQYRPPGAAGVPADTIRPPVWITSVASGNFQPLAVAIPRTDVEVAPTAPIGVPARLQEGAGQADGPDDEHTRSHEVAHAHPGGLLSGLAFVVILLTGLLLLVSLVLSVFPQSRERLEEPSPHAGGRNGTSGRAEESRIDRWTNRWKGVPLVLVRGAVLPRGVVRSVDWEVPDHLGWRVLDTVAVAVALLAFLAPVAYLSGLPAPWEDVHHPLRTWTGWIAVALLASYLALLAVWLACNIWTRGHRDLAPFVDLIPHTLAAVLGALGLLYCVQVTRLSGEGGRWASGADGSVALGLYRFRTLHLESATSGLLLFLLASIAIVVVAVWHHNRRSILHGERPPLEYLAPDPSGAGSGDARSAHHWPRVRQQLGIPMGRIRKHLRGAIGVPRVAVILAVALAPVGLVLLLWWPGWAVPDDPLLPVASFRTLDDLALEGGGWAATTRVLWVGLGMGFGFTAVVALHLVLVWHPFRRFLHVMAALPAAPALDRIPDRLRTLGRLHLFDPPADNLGEAQAETGHEAVWKLAGELWDTESFTVVREALDSRLPAPPEPGSPGGSAASLRLMVQALGSVWDHRPELAMLGIDRPTKGGDAEGLVRWARKAELVVAIEVTRYVGWVLRNLRRIALLLLFIILWTTAYLEAMPFPHHAAMTVFFIVLSVLGVAAVISIMAHLSQDDVLSRINGTPPGKIAWRSSSLLSAMVFVMLPVLGLLGTEIEPIGRVLFGWVGYVLRALGAG